MSITFSNKIIKYKYYFWITKDLKNQLETCLSEGKTLLISYCDVNKLSEDEKIIDVLRSSNKFFNKTSNKNFKNKVHKKVDFLINVLLFINILSSLNSLRVFL